MSETGTTSAQGPDYTPVLVEIRDQLQTIAEHHTERNRHLAVVAEQQAHRNRTIDRLLEIFERAGDPSRGLVTRPWNSPGGLSQAAMINALRESGQLDAVFDEIRNPTELP